MKNIAKLSLTEREKDIAKLRSEVVQENIEILYTFCRIIETINKTLVFSHHDDLCQIYCFYSIHVSTSLIR